MYREKTERKLGRLAGEGRSGLHSHDLHAPDLHSHDLHSHDLHALGGEFTTLPRAA